MVEKFRIAATSVGLPLSVLDVSKENLAGLYGAGMALVRPDQHVAWRGDTCADPAAIIATVRGA
jgi:hypothetical protein